MPAQIAVSDAGGPIELIALQDDWYQDVVTNNAAKLLREGAEWSSTQPSEPQTRWSLSGREIYVLAPHESLNGFVNVPRLMLGEQHVVLCVAERQQDVRDAIALTSKGECTALGPETGVPAGWIGFRGIVPQVPVAPSANGEILDALRPLPEARIAFENGIRIDRQTWLSGFPPHIRLFGNLGAVGDLVIDGQTGTLGQNGSYSVPGWDCVGYHTVWCVSATRSYSIADGFEEWEPWDAYRWSLGDADALGVDARPSVCGALVRPPHSKQSSGHPILVPASNPVLIGPIPGQITYCRPREDIRVGTCIGFPSFNPVWALPADILRCDKHAARVLLVGAPEPVEQVPRPERGSARHKRHVDRFDLNAWSATVGMAGRKGLKPEPFRKDILELWTDYKQHAKTIRRALK